jgi:hypothetical protein
VPDADLIFVISALLGDQQNAQRFPVPILVQSGRSR